MKTEEIILNSNNHSIEEWSQIINEKFHDFDLQTRAKQIIDILSILDQQTKDKIIQANLLAYGKTLGVTTFEEACNKLKISNGLPIFVNLSDEFSSKFIAEYKLIIIIKALNNGWYPDWNNLNEYKYYNWFDTRSGFSYLDTCYYYFNTRVASALCLKSRDLAWYSGNMFLDLYKYYYE